MMNDEIDVQISKDLRRFALGDMLMLTIPRDDFAKLMDFVARVEQAQQGDRLYDNIAIEDIEMLSRIASDLSQQADAQD